MKKSLLFLFTIFTTYLASAQVKSVVEYTDMPPYGFYLSSGWRYAPNDNPEYARADFDDSGWDSIDPTQTLYNLPQLKNVNVGWFRLHFKATAKVTDCTPVLTVWQNCASEIYLNGKLLRSYGIVSSDLNEVKPEGMNQLAQALQLIHDKEYVLAVRFSPWEGASYLKNADGFMLLNINSLSDYQSYEKEIIISNDAYLVLVSVFFLMSLLHLSFYRYDRAQRANLYLSFYTITSAIAFVAVCMQSQLKDARMYALVRDPSFFMALLSSIWTVKALGSLFGFAVRRLVIIMWFLFIVAIICMETIELNNCFGISSAAFQLINLVLAIKCIKSGKKGTGIIVAGFTISIIMIVLSWFPLGINLSLLTLQATVGLTYLAPAVGISLYLARDFALKSVLLREKLVQVEALSQKTLQQEHEKQELLAHQNELLEKQVNERTDALQKSLNQLRQAQAQLIQSEKMASLGELTAGIAHEIQNPLNFVNNFSDVSIELLDEMEEELIKGDTDEARAIAADVKDNLTKIAHHGRRTDSIVKGMLQHSRASSGQKEPTDINALADEYLRLAYHGLRAKDKTFNADLVTHFAEGLPKINVLPQDMGRVLLNLFTNAFYATQQRSKEVTDGSYKPVVEVATQQVGDTIKIVVKDNGTGIPDAIKDKILQPFFTTKPTGQGTGLGLSLSYDIVVKAHGGTIDIESAEGEGAAFIIKLPIN